MQSQPQSLIALPIRLNDKPLYPQGSIKNSVGINLTLLSMSTISRPTSVFTISGLYRKVSMPGKFSIAARSCSAYPGLLSLNIVTRCARRRSLDMASFITTSGVEFVPSANRPGPANRSMYAILGGWLCMCWSMIKLQAPKYLVTSSVLIIDCCSGAPENQSLTLQPPILEHMSFVERSVFYTN